MTVPLRDERSFTADAAGSASVSFDVPSTQRFHTLITLVMPTDPAAIGTVEGIGALSEGVPVGPINFLPGDHININLQSMTPGNKGIVRLRGTIGIESRELSEDLPDEALTGVTGSTGSPLDSSQFDSSSIASGDGTNPVPFAANPDNTQRVIILGAYCNVSRNVTAAAPGDAAVQIFDATNNVAKITIARPYLPGAVPGGAVGFDASPWIPFGAGIAFPKAARPALRISVALASGRVLGIVAYRIEVAP